MAQQVKARTAEPEFEPYHHICEGELTPTSANIMCMPPHTHTNKHNALYIVINF